MRFPSAALTTAAAIAASLALTGCGNDKTIAPGQQADAVAKVAAPQGQKWSQVITPTADGGFVMGNPDAKITLIEYGSLTCSHCADFAKEAEGAIKTQFVDNGQVAYEYRNLLRNELDGVGAALMKCAGKDRYYPLMENIMANQESFMAGAVANPSPPDIAALPDAQKFPTLARAFDLYGFFSARGISEGDMNACLSDFANLNAAQEVSNKGSKDFNVTGTPTFVLNGEVFSLPAGVAPLTFVADKLRAAGAR